jgi:hypothetical protein
VPLATTSLWRSPIGLVEWHQNGGIDELSPDCSRTKTAFRHATQAAMLLHQDNLDDFVRLMASRYPCHLLDPVLATSAEGNSSASAASTTSSTCFDTHGQRRRHFC